MWLSFDQWWFDCLCNRLFGIARNAPHWCHLVGRIHQGLTHIFFSSFEFTHYIDVIMTTMPSQITSLTVVYSTVYSDADQRKHQSSASLAFVWGIHQDRWIPRTKGQLRGKCFHLMTSSCQENNKSKTLRVKKVMNVDRLTSLHALVLLWLCLGKCVNLYSLR